MESIAQILNDSHARPCGKCENCLGKPLFSTNPSKELVIMAQHFIKEDFNTIEPRKKWPVGEKVDEKIQFFRISYVRQEEC